MAYFLAPALLQLRQEINLRWPDRDKASDGWIGDASHSARKSDHNPDYDAGGIVRAIDVDKDGIDVDRLLLSLIGSPRVAYVIWSGRIWQNPAVYSAGGWRAYSGTNGHYKHVHVSIRRGHEYGTQAWGILDGTPVENPVAGNGDLPDVTVDAPDPITPTDWFDMASQQDLLDAIEASRPVDVWFISSAGTQYEANMITGEVRRITSEAAKQNRKVVLSRSGIKFADWRNSAGTNEVDSPAAFGTVV